VAQQLQPQQRQILDVLKTLGGEASTRQIAARANLNTNDVAWSLGTMPLVHRLGGKGGNCRWVLRWEAISHADTRRLIDEFFSSAPRLLDSVSQGPDWQRERKLSLALRHMTDQTIVRGHRVACHPCWNYYMEQKRLYVSP
jgi:hypothetical protein